MAEYAIGIDLGTSNSCVAILRDGKIEVLPNTYGDHITASVVSFRENGEILVGNAAKANIIHDPKHTISSSKRLIGRYFFSDEVKKAQAIYSYRIVEGENHGIRIQVRNELYALPEISAMILREMKAIAEANLGQEVRKAVITVPAYFNDNQRQATKDAGRIAGLEVLRILNEPTAAAVAYGFGKGLSQKLAIYDLGGGTFDVSILEIGDDVFEVLSTCGDTFLGGDDFDDRIIDLLADEFLAAEGVNIRSDRYAFEKLKLAAENVKKTLSAQQSAEVRIPDIIDGPDGLPRSLQRVITRDTFASLTQDLVQRTFKVCDEALQQANLIAREIDGVILVGGPTRLPLIRDAVGAYFQKTPKTDVDPDEVVAMGAAIHAASFVAVQAPAPTKASATAGATQSAASASAPAPPPSAFLLDVTPLSLRIGVAGGFAETIIDRNTPVPIEQSRKFGTFQDNQESVKIRVYQGESRTATENEPLGEFEFSGFKRARRGEVEIEVKFEIDSDGIVNVSASEPETGKVASMQIRLSSGLSDDEISNIIAEDRTSRVKTTQATPRPGETRTSAPSASSRPAAPSAAESYPGHSDDLDLGADDLAQEIVLLDSEPTLDLESSSSDGLDIVDGDLPSDLPDLEMDSGTESEEEDLFAPVGTDLSKGRP